MSSQAKDNSGEGLIGRISKKISKLKGRYHHFKEYDSEKAIYGDRIFYSYGVRWVLNPDYERLKEEEKKLDEEHPGRMRHVMPEKIPIFDPLEGISLIIELFDSDEQHKIQRVIAPYTKIGKYSVEIDIEGADTMAIKEIRTSIHKIVDKEKENYEKKAND